jgi:hypothetical protein
VPLGGCGDQSCVGVAEEQECDNGLTCKGVTEGVCGSESVCDLTDYTTPETAIGLLPDVAKAIQKSLDKYSPAPNPFGLTPTGPALEGAISYARSWAEKHTTRRSIVLLATDGAPTGGCAPSRRAEIAALASVGAGATVPVRTFTVGVFSPADPNDPNMDATEGPDTIRAIATAGDGQAFIISDQDDVAAQFVDALNTIRGHGLTCVFDVPPPASGKAVDYTKVNIVFTPKAGQDGDTILYVDTAAGQVCDERGGWYYTVDPMTQLRVISACDATCSKLKDSVTGSVDIQVGCQTKVRDPVK